MNVTINEKLGMQGGLLVPDNMRGKGIARYLYLHGADQIGRHRNILGDALEGMEATYARMGTPNHTYVQHSYTGILDHRNTTDLFDVKTDVEIVKTEQIDFRDIMAYDQTIHPKSLPRISYLRSYLEKPQVSSYAAMRGKTITGYAASCKMESATFIGPVYGNSEETGFSLIQQCLRHIPDGETLIMITPDDNEAGVKVIEKLRLKVDGRATRIHTKFSIAMPLQKIFAGSLMSYIGLLMS